MTTMPTDDITQRVIDITTSSRQQLFNLQEKLDQKIDSLQTQPFLSEDTAALKSEALLRAQSIEETSHDFKIRINQIVTETKAKLRQMGKD